MNNIQDLIKEYKIEKTKKTERGELLLDFLNNINKERDGKKYKKLSLPFIALKLQHLSVQDLYAFLSMCNDRKTRNGSFSKFFWWAIKAK